MIYEAYSNKISKIGKLKAGDYQLYNNQWGRKHANGSSIFQKMVLKNKESPINCSWSWDWCGPYEENWHVKAYPEVNYGYSPWGYLNSNLNTLPKKVNELTNFSANYDAQFINANGRYNLAFEVWMAKSNPPKPSDVTTKIMVWVDYDKTWEFWGDNVSDVTINCIDYFLNIAHAKRNYEWKYISLRMKKPKLKGELDMLPILDYLLENGHISKDDYACNLELGTEIVSGSGKFNLSNYYVTVE